MINGFEPLPIVLFHGDFAFRNMIWNGDYECLPIFNGGPLISNNAAANTLTSIKKCAAATNSKIVYLISNGNGRA